MFRKGGVWFVPLFSQDFPRVSPAFSIFSVVDVVLKGAVEYILQIRYKDILLINPLPPPSPTMEDFNDCRTVKDFRLTTFSGYQKTKVRDEFIKSFL